MKPYLEQDGISIFHGDFRDCPLVAEADCIVADPPYGETNLEWDTWPSFWPGALSQLTKPNISLWCFGSARMFWDNSCEFSSWRFVQDVIWEKQNGSGFMADRFRRVHELVYHFVRKGVAWEDVYKSPVYSDDAVARKIYRQTKPAHFKNAGPSIYESTNGGKRLERSVQRIKNCHGNALNETQKPDELVEKLIRYSCPSPDGLVGSIFMGSGTDLVAAKNAGFRAFSCDIREQQCEVASKRLQTLLSEPL